MKKTVVLALALVLAVAGASMAASPSFSGELEVALENEDGIITGKYTLTPTLTFDVNLGEEGDNWQLEAVIQYEVDGLSSSQTAGFSLDEYKADLFFDPFTVTLARDYDLDEVETPLEYITVIEEEYEGDRVRVTADFSGVNVVAGMTDVNNSDATKGSDLRLLAETTAGEMTVGGAVRVNTDDTEDYDAAGYVKTQVDIVSLEAIVGQFSGEESGTYSEEFTAFGVKATADLTEQLSVRASYDTNKEGGEEKGYAVGATFTEGLIQVEGDYEELYEEATVSLVYRGAEDNLSFDDLFDGDVVIDDEDWDWFTTTAFAARLDYTSKDEANKPESDIRVRVAGPVTDQMWIYGEYRVESADDSFEVEFEDASGSTTTYDVTEQTQLLLRALGQLTDKLVIKPSVSHTTWEQTATGPESELQLDLTLEYSVGEGATIEASIGQIDVELGASDPEPERYTKVAYTIEF
ncbi:MAG: hypothetical protein H0Z37_08975 [Firmicutes bacterium]|nr:hypothetical protein [Bacillota bacterium]